MFIICSDEIVTLMGVEGGVNDHSLPPPPTVNEVNELLAFVTNSI